MIMDELIWISNIFLRYSGEVDKDARDDPAILWNLARNFEVFRTALRYVLDLGWDINHLGPSGQTLIQRATGQLDTDLRFYAFSLVWVPGRSI